MRDSEQKTAHRNRSLGKKGMALVEQAISVMDGMKDHWPLTLRQVYYQLVSSSVIENNKAEYQRLSAALASARIKGLVPWTAIADFSRSILSVNSWNDSQDFVSFVADYMGDSYRRDLMQSQPIALEVWTEKDALARVLSRVTETYCIPVIVARGYSSVSFVHECKKRVESSLENGKKTVILYFGDFDPSGWNMLPTMLETLQNEMGLGDTVTGERCALTPEQVKAYSLPYSPNALKEGDTRAKGFIEKFGKIAVELDALPPATLAGIVEDSIRNHLDLSQLEQEREIEADEKIECADLGKQLIEAKP